MSPSENVLPGPRVGYVLKCYPRFSETFIVREIIAREMAGEQISIASLRAPKDPRFHALIARVSAPVTWIPTDSRSLARTWTVLGEIRELADATGRFGPSAVALEALLDEDPDVAAQAVLVARWALTERIEHLHAHFASVAGRTARLAGLLLDIPWTLTAHAKDIFHEDNDPKRHEQVLGGADAVVAVCDMTAEWIRDLVPHARVRRIYNGMDVQEFAFRPAAWSGPAHSPAFGQLDEPAHLVGVGRLVEKKGWPDFIEAVRILRGRGLDVRASIAGAGVLDAELRALVARLELAEAITFHGPMPQHEVVELVRSATVFAAPCVIASDGDRDGLPTVLLESMALGTPVVATPVAGIPEAVEDDVTGLLIEQRSPAQLANAIARLITEPHTRDRLARAARRRIEERFDVRSQAHQLHLLTAELAARRLNRLLGQGGDSHLDAQPAKAIGEPPLDRELARLP